MDLTYVYGQQPLSPESRVQCNFSLVGSQSTGKYWFKTGFYGLTTMPADFQRVMKATLFEVPREHAFGDDILVVSRGSKIEHITAIEKTLRKLNKKNLSVKLTKCNLAQRNKLTPTSVFSLVRKTKPIESLKAPCTESQLKSFTG